MWHLHRGIEKGLVIAALLLTAPRSEAMEMNLGLTAVEEGNDTVRPAVSISFGLSVFNLGLTYYGRQFGPVREQTAILAFTKTLPIAGSDWFYINAGASIIWEYTAIEGFAKGSAESTLPESSYAPAAALGIGARLFKIGSFRSDINWTTNVVPAGFGGIFLAHGRKQCFTFSSGVEL